eukprot:scaffold79442_cov66-Phaeocystis_antarctica.AAC.8
MERKAESARVARRRNKEAAETLERELAALRAGTAGAEEPALLLTDAAYTVPAYRSEVPSPPPAAAVAEVYAPEGVSEDEAEAEAIAEAGASPPSHMAVWQPIAAAAASAEPHPSPSPSSSAGLASGKIAQPRAARLTLPASQPPGACSTGRWAALRAQDEPLSRLGPTGGCGREARCGRAAWLKSLISSRSPRRPLAAQAAGGGVLRRGDRPRGQPRLPLPLPRLREDLCVAGRRAQARPHQPSAVAALLRVRTLRCRPAHRSRRRRRRRWRRWGRLAARGCVPASDGARVCGRDRARARAYACRSGAAASARLAGASPAAWSRLGGVRTSKALTERSLESLHIIRRVPRDPMDSRALVA